MPAGRDCRSCGARLPGDIRWCTTCYEPVRELTARAPLHEGGVMGELRPAEVTSRTASSDTSFGLSGRLIISFSILLVTMGLVAFVFPGLIGQQGSDGLALFMVPAVLVPWLIIAGIVLRQTWRAVRVGDGPPAVVGPPAPRERGWLFGEPWRRSLFVFTLAVIVVMVAGVAYMSAGSQIQGVVLATAIATCFVLAMRWAWDRRS